MSLTLHFNQAMLTGLCLLPGAVVVYYVLLLIFHRQEIGALAIAGPVAIAVFIAGIVLIMLGIGMEIH